MDCSSGGAERDGDVDGCDDDDDDDDDDLWTVRTTAEHQNSRE